MKSEMETRQLNIALPPEMWAILHRLAKADEMSGASIEQLVTNLLDHVQQGVYRSGSWERGWLTQCIAEDAIEKAYIFQDDPRYLRDRNRR